MKRLISVFVLLTLLLSSLAVAASAEEILVIPTENWGKDSNGIYRINSANDLLAFTVNAEVNGWYADETVALNNDIDMAGVEWFILEQFRGTLEGNGHVIKNLTVTAASGTAAFIRKMINATVQNIRFENLNVNVTTSDNGTTVGLVAVQTTGNCAFKNVYVNGTAEHTKYRVSGFIGYVNSGKTVFENCVSEATLKTAERGSGFVGQLNAKTSVEFTDCAFIGDLSQCGRYSAGFVGCTVGDVKMTRCVSLGKENALETTGLWVFLDHQNQNAEYISTLEFVDCFAAGDARYAIGAHATRSCRMNLSVKYDGVEVFSLLGAETAVIAEQREAIENEMKYLAFGDTVNLSKEGFAESYSVLANNGWMITDETVAYGEGKTVAKILPTVTKNLMDGNSVVTMPDDPVDHPNQGGTEETPATTEPEATKEPEAPTKEPDVTSKEPENTSKTPEATNSSASTTEENGAGKEKGGCGAALGTSFAVMLAVMSVAGVTVRKKED